MMMYAVSVNDALVHGRQILSSFKTALLNLGEGKTKKNQNGIFSEWTPKLA